MAMIKMVTMAMVRTRMKMKMTTIKISHRSLEEGLGGRAPDLPASLLAPGLPDRA